MHLPARCLLLALLALAALAAPPPAWAQPVAEEMAQHSGQAPPGGIPAAAAEHDLVRKPAMIIPIPSIDSARLQQQIAALGALSATAPPNTTRLVFSPEDLAARALIKAAMEAAGLVIREDPMGNIFGRWEGSEPELGAVGSGSHTDAIPHAGAYDGVVGVLGAIEALAALKRAGLRPRRSLEAIMFTSEEPSRFGVGCIGSRVLSGAYNSPEQLQAAREAATGRAFAEVAAEAGYGARDGAPRAGPEAAASILAGTVLPPHYLSHFVELHIEQGPLLEEEGIPLGVVTAIAAPATLVVDYQGSGGHAGALLMRDRRDAGLAAAELAIMVEALVKETDAEDAVGTVGVMEIFPGAVNSVPSHAHLEIDIRDIDGDRRDAMVADVLWAAGHIATERKTPHTSVVRNQDPPATCAADVVDAIELAAQQMGLAHRKLVSRAYHDALFMARVARTGMIFIPCRGGISHKPEEFASPEAIAAGTTALALTLARLAVVV